MSTDRQAQRLKALKGGCDLDANRKKKEEQFSILRKTRRDEHLAKRRRPVTEDPAEEGGVVVYVSELFNYMKQATQTQDYNLALQGVQAVRRLLSVESNPPIDDVMPLVPRLVQLMSEPSEIAFEASWALTNIAAGNVEHVHSLVDCGAINGFIAQLAHAETRYVEQAIWGLANIAGESSELRDFILSAGVMKPLLGLLSTQRKLPTLRQGTWLLSNLSRNSPSPDWAIIKEAIPTLYQLLYVSDEEILTDAGWALSYLTGDAAAELVEFIFENGVHVRLNELLSHTDSSIQTCALRTIGNLMTGSALETSALLNAGALTNIRRLIESCDKRGLLKEAAWVLSNVAAGTEEDIEALLDSGLVPILLELVNSSAPETKREAAWALCNAVTGVSSANLVRRFHKMHVLPALIYALECPDHKLRELALDGMECLLRLGAKTGDRSVGREIEELNGIDQLEALQNDPVPSIAKRATKLLTRYFEVIDDMIMTTTSPQTNDKQQYVFGSQNGQTQFTFA